MMDQNTSCAAVVISVGILILASLSLAPYVSAQESSNDQVPAPSILESHEFNKQETYNGQARENFDNEKWQITIDQGGVKTLLMARNYSNGDRTTVDYSQNINFYIRGKFYIAMFNIDHVVLTVMGQRLTTPLKTCDHFEVTHSPVKYDGTIPTLDCNITYKEIRVYSDRPGDSSYDLSLIHHIRGDWNQTSIKIEALFDFSHTEFYNGTNPPIGEPFAAEIFYVMQLTDPERTGVDTTVKPSDITNSTLNYNLTLDNGSTYALSKLEMKDIFTIYNESGAHSAMGNSSMKMAERNTDGSMSYNPNAAIVTHGFPNLTYKDTQSIKSDPEITIYHDRVTGNGIIMIAGAGAIAAVAAICAVVLVRKKKRKGQDEERVESKKD